MHFQTLRSLFRNRNFTVFFVGNGLSVIGNWISIVTIAWLTWEFTGSTLWLGIMATAQVAPTMIVTPWAGVLADRFSRPTVVFLAQAGAFTIALGLFIPYEFDGLNIYSLFLGRALLATFLGLSQPARMALTADLVEQKDLAGAVALGSITFSTARFIGPAIAGAVIAFGDIGLAFLLNALSFLPLLAAMKMLKLRPKAARDGRDRGSVAQEIRGGVSYIIRHPGIATLFALFLIRIVSIGSITQFYAAFADIVFQRGADGLAILTSAAGLGSLFGGLWMARFRSTANLVTTLCAGGLLSAVATIVFVVTPYFPLAIGITAAYSFVTTLFFVSGNTLTQLAVLDEMRGRVMSFWALFDRAGPAFGAILMGVLTELFGLRLPFLYAAIIMGAGVSIAWFRRSGLGKDLTTAEPVSGTG